MKTEILKRKINDNLTITSFMVFSNEKELLEFDKPPKIFYEIETISANIFMRNLSVKSKSRKKIIEFEFETKELILKRIKEIEFKKSYRKINQSDFIFFRNFSELKNAFGDKIILFSDHNKINGRKELKLLLTSVINVNNNRYIIECNEKYAFLYNNDKYEIEKKENRILILNLF